ncbi:methyl-accepting chemotaxis protein [Oceanobacillus sp. CAU 1775]
MKRLSNIFKFKKLRQKILFSFSIVLFFVVVLCGFMIYSIKTVNDDLKTILDQEMEVLITSEKLVINLLDRTRLIQGHFLFGDIEYKRSYDEGLEESTALEHQAIEIIESADFITSLEKMSAWGEVAEEIFSVYQLGRIPEAREILNEELEPFGIDLINEFQLHANHAEDRISTLSNEIQSNITTMMLVGVVISVIVIIISIFTALTTARMITKPIRTLMKRMKSIASGNLDNEPLNVATRDEIGQLVTAANEMNKSMSEIILKISDVTNTLTSHSEELTESTHEVRQGTKQISSTMEQLASGSETQANQANALSGMIANFSVKMEKANDNTLLMQKESNQVLEMTNEGSIYMDSSTKQMASIDTIVQAVVEKVRGLDEKTQDISKLVTVIKDVADQTNLLALNAAIEAARAGEHGRGFAVVADEVSKLAEQVGHSVTDISEIVSTIQLAFSEVTSELDSGYQEVKEGTLQIQKTGENFTGIRASVTDMFDKIQHISDYLSEFAISSQKMSTSIQEISAVSEQSAAGAQQTFASTQQSNSAMEEVTMNAQDLSQLAEDLNELIRQFKV